MSGMKNYALRPVWPWLVWLGLSVALTICAIEFVQFAEHQTALRGSEITSDKHPVGELCSMSRRVFKDIVVIDPSPHEKLLSSLFNFLQIDHTNLYRRTPFFGLRPDEKRGQFLGLSFYPQIRKSVIHLCNFIVSAPQKTDVHDAVLGGSASAIFKHRVEFPSTDDGNIRYVGKYRFVMDSLNEYVSPCCTNEAIGLYQRRFGNTLSVVNPFTHVFQLTPEHDNLNKSCSEQAESEKSSKTSVFRIELIYRRFLFALGSIVFGLLLALVGSYFTFDKNQRLIGATLWIIGLFEPAWAFWRFWTA